MTTKKRISALLTCVIPFLEVDYKDPSLLEIIVMVLAIITAGFVLVDISQHKKVQTYTG